MSWALFHSPICSPVQGYMQRIFRDFPAHQFDYQPHKSILHHIPVTRFQGTELPKAVSASPSLGLEGKLFQFVVGKHIPNLPNVQTYLSLGSYNPFSLFLPSQFFKCSGFKSKYLRVQNRQEPQMSNI